MSNKDTLLQELLSGVIPGSFTSSQLAAVHRYDPADEEEQETGNGGATKMCPACRGRGHDQWMETCVKCGGHGEVTANDEYIDPDEEEQEVEDPSEGDTEVDAERGGLPDTELDLNDQVEEPEDPDRAGVIRQVDNAHLVYKRENEEGSFDELWTYNIGDDIKDELEIRRNILAGTDIPPKKTRSEDGSQRYELTTLGNAQLLKITGLPQ